MKKILLLLFIFLINSANVFAIEIVYPKKNPCIINANSTFFIGSANPSANLKINDIEVQVHENGSFAQLVPLNLGKNEFQIVSIGGLNPEDEEKMTFIIERPQPSTRTFVPLKLLEYPILNNFFTKSDNIPLRTTPVDAGINRMSHLPKNLPLLVNGEKGGFYRVYLNSKNFGWISKYDVAQKTDTTLNISPIKIIDFKCDDDKDFYIYEFELERKTPFTVKEENGLTLQLFNMAKDENSRFEVEDNTLTFNIPVEKLMGYDAYFVENKFVLKVRKPVKTTFIKPLKNLVIAVDAGHGGSEYGAIGCCGDKEKDINLAIAKNLQAELLDMGASVVMTRESDIAVSLPDRIKIAKDNNASLFLSIHANAIPDGSDPNKNRGTSVYYYHNQAKPLAQSILESMTVQAGTINDKVRQGSLALVRPTASVSVLIEVAYIINPDDYAMLLDKDFQQKCAKSIADGIEVYLKE